MKMSAIAFDNIITLDDLGHADFDGFEGGKTHFTFQTGSSALGLRAIGNQARVDHFGFWMCAEWAMHIKERSV